MRDGKEFYRGVQAAVPTMMGYASIGFACGVVAANANISAIEMLLMSLLVYAGSAQFVMCAMILAGASLLSIVVTVFFINLRMFLLSLHVTTMFKRNRLGENLLIGSFLTDESYAILLREHIRKPVTSSWMYGNNFASYATWVICTVLGNVIGGMISQPEVFGLDFALIAMFVGIFYGQLEMMLHKISLVKVGMIVGTVVVVYLMLSIFIVSYLAVLVATVIGCFVGVVLDEK